MTPRRSWALAGACLLLLCAACARMLSERGPAERLFFALQIQDGDRVLARPQLVGAEGKRLTFKLVQPDSPDHARLALELVPEREGSGYRVQLKLALPDRAEVKVGELALGHGEEKKIEIPDPVRPLTVHVLLMRIASPEFETYLKLAAAAPATT